MKHEYELFAKEVMNRIALHIEKYVSTLFFIMIKYSIISTSATMCIHSEQVVASSAR